MEISSEIIEQIAFIESFKLEERMLFVMDESNLEEHFFNH